jgi:CRP/FNR family transcriptional regulator, cyclic AMP receptor protein
VTPVHLEFPEQLGRLALFADLPGPELEQIANSGEQVSFREGQWVIRQGDPQSAVFFIVEGEVAVVIDDEDRRVLPKGSFFGEVSVLLEEPASASVMTRTPVSCLVVPGEDAEDFLVSHPQVLYRMLKAEARRLRTASEWRI